MGKGSAKRIIIVLTRAKDIAREREESKAKEKESVSTVEKQVAYQETVKNPGSFSTHVTIVVKRVIKRRSASCLKEQEKGRECMR